MTDLTQSAMFPSSDPLPPGLALDHWTAIAAFIVYQPSRSVWGGRTREEALAAVAALLGITVERLEEALLK